MKWAWVLIGGGAFTMIAGYLASRAKASASSQQYMAATADGYAWDCCYDLATARTVASNHGAGWAVYLAKTMTPGTNPGTPV